jgi:concentrative nucleoside transporter, CNT family
MKHYLKSLLIAMGLILLATNAFAIQQNDTIAQAIDTIMQASDSATQLEASDALIAESTSSILLSDAEKGTSFKLVTLLRGLLGMVVLIFIAFILSSNRRAISWKVVGIGLSIQVLLAIGVLKVPFIMAFFEFIGKIFIVILDFTRVGSEFLLGGLMNVEAYGFIFAFQVLPTIIFFSALTSLLFYLGIIQKVVYALAWLMTKAMRLSGAESLSVAGNIFLGQTESPLLIKAYLAKMTKSEMLLVMIGGMATMAGGVLAAYISFLGGTDPVTAAYVCQTFDHSFCNGCARGGSRGQNSGSPN